jgi:hypothetical protein
MSREDVKNWFLSLSQWIYVIPDTNIICSHAGISNTFLKNCMKELQINDSIPYLEQVQNINKLPPSPLFAFTPDNPYDCNGESISQPCVWIRPNSLAVDCNLDYIQIVGHTQVDNPFNLKDIDYVENPAPDIWLCDSLRMKKYITLAFNPLKVEIHNADNIS